MASFRSKSLWASMLLSVLLVFSGCAKDPTPGGHQHTPAPKPGTQQNVPAPKPGSQQEPDITMTAPTIPQQTHSSEDPVTPTLPEETAHSAEVLEFPVSLENGDLLLQTPFTYDGPNPDCDNAEGRNIAAITVKNCSGSHLISASFTLILDDGTEIPFLVEHIPSTRQATAFALDNSQLPSDASWSQILVTAEFAEAACLREHGLAVQETGAHIDLSNETGTELTNLMIYCHNLLGDEYFGGKAYPYKVNNIPAGGTASVDAMDCILGIAEVAYATGNQE